MEWKSAAELGHEYLEESAKLAERIKTLTDEINLTEDECTKSKLVHRRYMLITMRKELRETGSYLQNRYGGVVIKKRSSKKRLDGRGFGRKVRNFRLGG